MSTQPIDFSQYEDQSAPPEQGKKIDFSKYEGPVTSTGIAAPQGTESLATAGVKGVKDLATGVAQGAATTTAATTLPISKLLNKIPYIGEYLAPKAGIQAEEAAIPGATTPQNLAQTIGKTGEQVGEWMIPSGAEEKAATLASEALPKLGKAIPIAARIGANAVESGIRNKSQGGDFTTGAEAGAGGELLNQGLQKAAPIIAESALGVTNRMRGHGRTIGDAALNEVSAVRPTSILKQSGDKVRALTGQLEQAASNSTVPASTSPAIKVVDDALHTYQKRNSPMVGKLQSLSDQLTNQCDHRKSNSDAVTSE